MRALRYAILAVLLSLVATPASAFTPTKTPVSPNGVPAQVDLPTSQHMRNTGGSDGAGLCVFTSVTVAARWQNLPEMEGFRAWAEKRPGGSLPDLLVADLKEYADEKGIKLPSYVQHVGGDAEFVRLVLSTRRMPAITYAGFDDFYGYNGRIYHMVNALHADGKDGAILDNNHPGEWYWMDDKQLFERFVGRGGRRSDKPFRPFTPFTPDRGVNHGILDDATSSGDGWAFVWTAPPPPPKRPVGPVVPALKVVWEKRLTETGAVWVAYVDGKLLGAYDKDGWHSAANADAWFVDVSPLPQGVTIPTDFPLPERAFKPYDPVNTPKYVIDGVEVDEAAARAAILNDLSDDSNKYHLSFVGVDRATVSEWMSGPLAPYADRLHVQAYNATDWAAKDRLKSAVTLQEPAKAGGKVVRESAAVPTADSVRKLLASVFEPAPIVPVPAPITPVTPVSPDAPDAKPSSPAWLLLLIAVLTVLFARRK